MSHETVNPSETPRPTKQKGSSPKLRRAINTVTAPTAEAKKKRVKKVRLYKDYPNAYLTRSDIWKYRTENPDEVHGYVISLLKLDDVEYIQLTSSLTQWVGCDGVVEFNKKFPGVVRTLQVVTYPDSKYTKKPPLETSPVHCNSFVKYDWYKGMVIEKNDNKKRKAKHFLAFLQEVFDFLQLNRDFVEPSYTPGFIHASPDPEKIEEIPNFGLSSDPLAVSVPATVSGKSADVDPFDATMEAEMKSLEEQDQHVDTNEIIRLQEENKDLRSRISHFAKYRDWLVKASSMKEGPEKDRHAKALMSVAVKDKTKSEG
jgi:hypothetical protein